MKSMQLVLLAAAVSLAACADRTDQANVESAVVAKSATTGETAAAIADAAPQRAAGAIASDQVAAMEEAASAGAAAAAKEGDELDLALGKKVYSANCVACHGSGAAGAPKLDDQANWAPRLAQGTELLFTHAIKGFQGSMGYMPPKGGFASLSDDHVKAAVAYMVDQVE